MSDNTTFYELDRSSLVQPQIEEIEDDLLVEDNVEGESLDEYLTSSQEEETGRNVEPNTEVVENVSLVNDVQEVNEILINLSVNDMTVYVKNDCARSNNLKTNTETAEVYTDSNYKNDLKSNHSNVKVSAGDNTAKYIDVLEVENDNQ